MNKKQMWPGVGLAVGGLALGAVYFGGYSQIPDDMLADNTAQDITTTSGEFTAKVTFSDPDGAGPLPAGVPRLSGNLVVDMRDGLTAEQIRDWQKRYGIELKYNSPYSYESGLMIAQVPEERLPQLLEELNRDEWVESAEPNYVMQGIGTSEVGQEQENGITSDSDTLKTPEGRRDASRTYPNDPLYKHQWHMDMIGAPQAWRFTQGKGAVVAVIDTGVAWKKAEGFVAVEDLAQTTIKRGYDFVNRNDLALDDNAHGTHVAGTIAQSTNNGIGVAGVAPRAAIMPVKVLSGQGMGSVANIADGIRFAAQRGANVINMSLGGPLPSRAMANAMQYAQDRGVTIVCAAGNENRERVGYPAGYDESFTVAALNAKGERAWYSNYGGRVDIAAPGGDTRSDENGDGVPDGVYQNTITPGNPTNQGYYAFQGTSMATPHVAGAAALLVSQGVTSPSAVKRILSRSTSHWKSDDKGNGLGAGALNVAKASKNVGFWHGLERLLLALLLALGVGALSQKRCWGQRLACVSGLVMCSSGLFLVPFLSVASSWWSFISLPVPAWDVALLGAWAHGNLLICSCLVPVLLGAAVTAYPRLSSLVTGIALGWASYLLFEVWSGATLLHIIPSGLSWLWWLANGLFCICLAQVTSDMDS